MGDRHWGPVTYAHQSTVAWMVQAMCGQWEIGAMSTLLNHDLSELVSYRESVPPLDDD